jgi:hypothetical protein
MSFQAYIDNIFTKTGKTPDDFKKLAEEKGFLVNGAIPKEVKATQITDWLKADFGLGHGHAMAIYALFKGIKGGSSPKSKTQTKISKSSGKSN